jgi:hypothetical protein
MPINAYANLINPVSSRLETGFLYLLWNGLDEISASRKPEKLCYIRSRIHREQLIPPMTTEFYNVLHKHFPGTLPLEEYMKQTFEVLEPYGFEDENTMGMVALCRDEITEPLFHEVVKYWGKTFNCCSLGGFLTIGKTGLHAATEHTPIYDGIRRFTFYGMPHIAISKDGEIGKVYREGLDNASHACGSLEAIVNELRTGHFNMFLDFADLEQSLIRQKILSHIKYGVKPDLIRMTKLACNII